MTIAKFDIYKDCFNLLCGDKLGSGIHRDVYECLLRPELVVKVEYEVNYRYFANVMEMKFWDDHQHYKKVADWLAPCEYMSPDGRILLQRKCKPLDDWSQFPDSFPSFLTDIKLSNFGLLDGRVVCMDYAMTILNPSVKMKKVDRFQT